MMHLLWQLSRLLILTTLLAPASAMALAPKGEIDLSAMDVEKGLRLQGDWYFFANELLTPADFLQRLEMPNYQAQWTQVGPSFVEASQGSTNNRGFATYAIQLKNIPSYHALGFTGIEGYTAFKVYFFNKSGQGSERPIQTVGQVATQAGEALAQIASWEIVDLPRVPGAEAFMLIQVSNFHHSWGGLWMPPLVGDKSSLMQTYTRELKLNYLIIGALFFTAVYSLSLYSRRREDKGSLFLGLLSIFLVFRSLGYLAGTDPLFSNLQVNFNVTMKAIYISMILVPVLVLHFLVDYFPRQAPRPIIKWITIAVTPLLIFIALTNSQYFTAIGVTGQYLGLSIGVFCMVILGRALIAGEQGAKISNLGCYAVFFGSIMDMMTAAGIGSFPPNCIGYGLVMFTTTQSQIVGVRFALAFRKAHHLGQALQLEVDRQTREIKSIMESIELGIFTLVDDHLHVGDQYSKHLARITQKDQIHGKNLQEILLDQALLSQDSKDQIISTLHSSMQVDAINFEMNSHCLLHQINFQAAPKEPIRTLELEWTPIVNSENLVEKVLVCARDVTDILQLKERASAQEADLTIINELINIAEDRFHRFLVNSISLLTQSQNILAAHEKDPQPAVIRALFMNMHTLKGMARTYHFLALSAAAHQAEQCYVTLQKDCRNWPFHQLQADLDLVTATLRNYERMGTEKLGWSLGERVLRINHKKLEQTLAALQSIPAQSLDSRTRRILNSVEYTLGSECYRPIQEIIGDALKGIDSLARNLNKNPPRVEVDQTALFLGDKGADLIHSILSHILRNSLDHGLEPSSERLQLGKDPTGLITIQVERLNNDLLLTMQDDGRGLNLSRIAALGREKNLIPQAVAWSDEELAELIFHADFSTALEVTDISGRGVGMMAVKTYLQEQNGRISIQFLGERNAQGYRPFAFQISIPNRLCWFPQTNPMAEAV